MTPAVQKLRRLIDAAGLAACTAIVAVLSFGALPPLLRHRGDAGVRRLELTRQRQKAAAAKASVAALHAQLEAARAALAANPIKLEDARQVNRRLARVTDLAASHGLDVQGVDPGQVTGGSHYQTVPLKLSGTGGFRGCARFLRDLHDQFPDTAVISFRLEGNGQEAADSSTFSFELRWYAAPAQATALAE